jgi:hypothetical protein
VTSWLKAKFGRARVSTVVLIVAFVALFWVYHNFEPRPAPETPPTAVVPPGFVPDPNYTWVPRTNVRRPKETLTTETTTPTTTSPTETTTSPGETTTSPTSPTSTESSPTTTSPGATTSPTPTLTPTTGSGPAQTTPAPPR